MNKAESNTSLILQSATNSEATTNGDEGHLSTSSSLGWSDGFSDEYDDSTRTKVFKELLLMDKILKGEINIPPYCDRDEYDQWMQKFPSLSIWERSVSPVNSPSFMFSHDNVHRDIRIKEIPRSRCDKISTGSHCGRKNVIMWNNFHIPTENVRNLKKAKDKPKKMRKLSNDILDSEQYLKISGMDSIAKRNQTSKHKPTNHYSLLTATKGCYSLPLIKSEHVTKKQISSNFVNKKAWGTSPPLDHEDPDHLVLPPITAKNSFRSISATPRQFYKSFSALSMDSNLFVKHTN